MTNTDNENVAVAQPPSLEAKRYASETTTVRVVGLVSRIGLLLSLATLIPCLIATFMLLSSLAWLIWKLILFFAAVFTLFLLFLDKGYRDMLSGGGGPIEPGDAFLAEVHRIGSVAIPVVAAVVVACSVIAIVVGCRHRGMKGATAAISCGVIALIIALIGVVLYYMFDAAAFFPASAA